MQGEKGKHARVPITNTLSGGAIGLVLDVETPTGGTKVSANPAVDAGKMNVFPEVGLIQDRDVKCGKSGCIYL
jgi:hypothetical protein